MKARRRAVGALVGSSVLLGLAPAQGDPLAADRVKSGVVVLERAGEPVALGFILARDGRILTALSPLGDGDGADVRYADGTVVRGRIDHRDRVWGLALLVPERARGEDGLVASEADPLRAGAKLAAFTSSHGRARPLPLAVHGRSTFFGEGDAPLHDALDLASKLGAKDLGGPIVDASGQVVGMIARGCVPLHSGSVCSPVPLGAPVRVLREFLGNVRSAPPPSPPPAPWLGMQVVADAVPFARGVRVEVVKPESPADEAHLRSSAGKGPADLVVALDGTPIRSPEALAELICAHAAGDRVSLLIVREGRFLEVPVTLRAPPGAK